MDSGPALLSLLHLCDSLFPTGGYAHSDGLEAAASTGAVADATAFRGWLRTLLREGLAYGDGPAVCLAWEYFSDRAWPALRALDDEVYAQRPSSTGRSASRAVGTRLLRTWARLRPGAPLEAMLAGGADAGTWTLAVAFGSACASSRIPLRAALEGFMYTRLSAAASAAMRLMPLGQLDAHALVTEMLDQVPGIVDGIIARRDRPSTFTPLADIAAMSQQYVVSRLFRS